MGASVQPVVAQVGVLLDTPLLFVKPAKHPSLMLTGGMCDFSTKAFRAVLKLNFLMTTKQSILRTCLYILTGLNAVRGSIASAVVVQPLEAWQASDQV